MALSTLNPDPEKVAKNANRMKEIIETTWLRNPVLNDPEEREFQRLKKEIEDMGLWVTWETSFSLDVSGNFKLCAKIDVLIPKNTTLH